MLPLEIDGPFQGGVGEELLPLWQSTRRSAFEYATALPACADGLTHTVDDSPDAIRDAFTLDGGVTGRGMYMMLQDPTFQQIKAMMAKVDHTCSKHTHRLRVGTCCVRP